jgi:hypothetical protein
LPQLGGRLIANSAPKKVPKSSGAIDSRRHYSKSLRDFGTWTKMFLLEE